MANRGVVPSSMIRGGNVHAGLPSRQVSGELVDLLAEGQHVRVERIVSTGQTTPEGQWYDEVTDEWVLLVLGEARLRIEDESADRALGSGDWLFIPAHCRHRVVWTSVDPPAVWLAVHFAPAKGRVDRAQLRR